MIVLILVPCSWHVDSFRYLAYDDFIAVAEDLVNRKITSPARLGNVMTLFGEFYSYLTYLPMVFDFRQKAFVEVPMVVC